MLRWYKRRLHLLESCGRNSGWFIERNSVRLAKLTDYRWEEMFWDSYKLTPLTSDDELNQSLLSDFWDGNGAWTDVYYRNIAFPEVMVVSAFPAATPFQPSDSESDRITIRSLYACAKIPAMPWESLILWWRRRNPSAVKNGDSSRSLGIEKPD